MRKASVISGMSLITPLAILKFPDQMRVTKIARKIPMEILR
jgi:hypothetical protein